MRVTLGAWTEDMTELARHQDNPHVHFDPLRQLLDGDTTPEGSTTDG